MVPQLVEAFGKTGIGERARNELRSKNRLMVSGSAALPEVNVMIKVRTMEARLSGFCLLFTYSFVSLG